MSGDRIISAVLTAVCIALGFIAFKQCDAVKIQKQINSDNIRALTDSVHHWKDKAGHIVAEKTLLIAAYDDIRECNEELRRSLDEMRIKNAALAVQLKAAVSSPEIRTETRIDTVYEGVKFNAPFDYSNEWRILRGTAAFDESVLSLDFTEDKVLFDCTAAVVDNKILLKSSNPYVQFNEIIGGVTQDSKIRKRHWGAGLTLGVGFQYGLIHKKLDFGPQFGIGFQYMF